MEDTMTWKVRSSESYREQGAFTSSAVPQGGLLIEGAVLPVVLIAPVRRPLDLSLLPQHAEASSSRGVLIKQAVRFDATDSLETDRR